MRAWLIAAALAAALTALLFARPHATQGPPMRDFEAYYAAGAIWNSGGDAYSQDIWRIEAALPGVEGSRYQALPFVAPPAMLPVFATIAKLPFATANTLWRTLLIASACGLALVTLRFAQVRNAWTSFAAIALAAIGFGPLTSALALGQLALPAMLFASLAVLRPGCAFAAWIQPNIGVALVSQVRTWAGALLFAALCFIVEGANGLRHYVDVLHRHSIAERFSAIQVTPTAIAYGFGASQTTAAAIGVLVTLIALICWFLLMRRTGDLLARFCGTCAILPLAMPFFHEHDLIVLYVPALVYAIRCEQRWWPLAALGAMLAGTDWLGLAQRPDATTQALLLVTALGFALMALRERVDATMFAIPACALALIAVAALVARAHPAPVWPEAMGALPHAIAALDITDAWHAQQHATGLLAQQPLWAALRLLSLIGCALTAAAVAASSRYPADSKNPLLDRAASF